MKVLCFDPSGNFSKNEGQGTTGWALFEKGELKDFGSVSASDFDIVERYWFRVRYLIAIHEPDVVVCESFKLQPGKAMAQSWSQMETPQLIGVLRMQAWAANVEFVLQDPSCKVRVADPILERMGILEKRGRFYYCMDRMTNDHQRDAIRHGVYFLRYGGK